MSEKRKPTRYTSNMAYLEDEAVWLALRTKRLELERDMALHQSPQVLAHRVGPLEETRIDEFQRQCTALLKQEADQRAIIDRRLERHREGDGEFLLGLDAYEMASTLDAQERLILLVLTFAAMSPSVAQKALNDYAPAYRHLRVAELVEILGPENMEQWENLRERFAPDSPLLRDGLITLDYPGADKLPGDIWEATASLTLEVFELITRTIPQDKENGADNKPQTAVTGND